MLFIAVLALGAACSPATPPPEQQVPEQQVPEQQALEAIILGEVFQAYTGCTSSAGVVTEGEVYSLFCRVTADSSHFASITRYNSESAAWSQFDTLRGNEPVTCFHGYNLFSISTPNEYKPYIIQERVTWQADAWLIQTQNIYDRGYSSSNLLGTAEDVYASAVEHGLFPEGTCP